MMKYISFDKSVLIPSAPHSVAIHAVVHSVALGIVLPELPLIVFSVGKEQYTPSALQVTVELT